MSPRVREVCSGVSHGLLGSAARSETQVIVALQALFASPQRQERRLGRQAFRPREQSPQEIHAGARQEAAEAGGTVS